MTYECILCSFYIPFCSICTNITNCEICNTNYFLNFNGTSCVANCSASVYLSK